MEVHIDLAAGGERPTAALEDTFVSIRVGKERRQGRFTGARKVSFSSAAGQERSCRVDVFRHMGSGYVELRGGDSEVADVEVPIGSPGLPRVRWRLCVRRDVQAATPLEREQRAQLRRDAAHEYWKKHHLDTELVDIIRHLLQERPENPRAFLSSSIRRGALAASTSACGDGGLLEDDFTSGQEDGPALPQRAPALGSTAAPSQEEVRPEEPSLKVASGQGVEPVHPATGSAAAQMAESSSVPPGSIPALGSAAEPSQEVRLDEPLLGAAAERGVEPVHTATGSTGAHLVESNSSAPGSAAAPSQEVRPEEPLLDAAAEPGVEPLHTATGSTSAQMVESSAEQLESIPASGSAAEPSQEVRLEEPLLGVAAEGAATGSSDAQLVESNSSVPTEGIQAPAPEGPQEAGSPRQGAPVVASDFELPLEQARASEHCSPERLPEPMEEALSTEAAACDVPQEAQSPRPATPAAHTTLEPQLGLVAEIEHCSPSQSLEPAEEPLLTEAAACDVPQEAQSPRPATPAADTPLEPQLGLVTEIEHCSPSQSLEPAEEPFLTEAVACDVPQEPQSPRPATPAAGTALEPQLGLATECEYCSPAQSQEPVEEALLMEAAACDVPQEPQSPRSAAPAVDTALEPELGLVTESDHCSPAQSLEPVEEPLSTEAAACDVPQEVQSPRPATPAADTALEPQLGLVTEREHCGPAQSLEPVAEPSLTEAAACDVPQEAQSPRPATPAADTAPEPQLGLVTEREHCSPAQSLEPVEEPLLTEAAACDLPQEAQSPRSATPAADTALEPQFGLVTESEHCSPAQSLEPVEEPSLTEAAARDVPQDAQPPRSAPPAADTAFEPQLGLVKESEHCSPAQAVEPVEKAAACEGPQEAGSPRPGTSVVDTAFESQSGLITESEHCSPAPVLEPVEESEFMGYYKEHVLDLSMAWVTSFYEQFSAEKKDLRQTAKGTKECCHEIVSEVLKAPRRPGIDAGVEVQSCSSAPEYPQEQAKEELEIPDQKCEKRVEEDLGMASEETAAEHASMKTAPPPASSMEEVPAPRPRQRFPSTITAVSSIGPADSAWTVYQDSPSPSASSQEDAQGARGASGRRHRSLPRSPSDEYAIECFFLTELEPSEPSARADESDAAACAAEGDGQQTTSPGGARGRLEVPLEVNMVDVELQGGSRNLSSRGSQATGVPSPPGTPWIIKGIKTREEKPSVPEVPEAEQAASDDASPSWFGALLGPRMSKASSSTSRSFPLPMGPLPSTASGTVRLRVTIQRAMNLRNADWFDLSDPYCILKVRGDKPKKFKTKVILDNLHPVWEESYDFDYISPLPLEFTIWDKDFGKPDDFLGKARLTPDMFWPDGFDGFVKLEDAGKKDGKDALLFLKVQRLPSPA